MVEAASGKIASLTKVALGSAGMDRHLVCQFVRFGGLSFFLAYVE
jgi:hypothetical protein